MSDCARRWRLPPAVGPFPLSWLNELPGVAHHVTGRALPRINAHSLRPAAAWWLKPRFDGVRMQAGRRVLGVMTRGNQVGVELNTGLRVYDHVLLATGYKLDISKLGILAPDLLQRIVGCRRFADASGRLQVERARACISSAPAPPQASVR